MATRYNTLEGGSDTTTISAANSGGASGDAFTSVFGGAVTYSNLQKRGLLSMRMVDATGSTGVRWTGLALGTADIWGRVYIYLTANIPGGTLVLLGNQAAAGTFGGGVVISTLGKLQAYANGVAVGTLGSTSVTLNQWVRIEVRIKPSATVGEIEWRLYNTADSTTIDETITTTALNTQADNDGMRFGSSTGAPTTPFTMYFDDLGVSSVTWLGPSLGFTNTVVPTVTGGLTVGGTLTANPGTWTPTPSSYNYYWPRMDDALGTNLVEIGATGSTYTLSSSDLTKYIRAGVIPVQ